MSRAFEPGDVVHWTRFPNQHKWTIGGATGQASYGGRRLYHATAENDPGLSVFDVAEHFEHVDLPRFPFALIWIDLETTGLDPHKDSILELAYTLTNFQHPYLHMTQGTFVNPIAADYILRDPSGAAWSNLDDLGLDPVVRVMHEKSGLFRALQSERQTDITTVTADLLALSAKWPDHKDERVVVAGNSVHFDLAFLREHLPAFAKRLSYRTFDVRSVQMFCESMGMPKGPKTEAAHRARKDLEYSIATARSCAAWLAGRDTSGNAHIERASLAAAIAKRMPR